MMGRGKAKDVAGWASEHLCVALGHPDLGRELTNFLNHFIQGNLGEGTQRALMLQTVTPFEQGNQRKATTTWLCGDVPQSRLRRPRPNRSSEPRKGIRTDAVRRQTEGSGSIGL